MSAKPCLGPRKSFAIPARKLPAGAIDTHFHVFGPVDRFPYAEHRKYTPPESPYEAYIELAGRLGIDKAVCVHPNVHGPDNAVTLDAIERSNGRLLGIIKMNDQATFSELARMNALGVRGIRFAFNPEHGGELDHELFLRACDWAGELQWCIDLHMAPEDLPGLAENLSRLSVPVVIDHMARIDPAGGIEQAPFKVLLQLMQMSHVWVKLSGADRITRSGPPYDDVVPFARALVDAAPDRVLWGSDWPHSGYFDASRMPDDAALVDASYAFVPDPILHRKLMVDNPARLFRIR